MMLRSALFLAIVLPQLAAPQNDGAGVGDLIQSPEQQAGLAGLAGLADEYASPSSLAKTYTNWLTPSIYGGGGEAVALDQGESNYYEAYEDTAASAGSGSGSKRRRRKKGKGRRKSNKRKRNRNRPKVEEEDYSYDYYDRDDGYNAPSSGYNAPSSSYDAPSYNAPSYEAPSYSAPTDSYGAPSYSGGGGDGFNDFLNALAAFLPIGLFLAAIPPNLITINTGRRRKRSDDNEVETGQYMYPFLDRIVNEMGVDHLLSEVACQKQLFCEMAYFGQSEDANTVQKILHHIAALFPQGFSRTIGADDVFKVSQSGECDIFKCLRQPNK